ncbi:hypothetical protein HELRODRAFT_170496 [Helobdella robusta]|uniref:Uncharacterized protein n=1 Tax=Helobdella robusta TaxID=6412 RepID=T1F346_HELRO|nr:hypothetical protein HELRODRAFT_170496 [Helobdella robusta]ESO07185.1 hypothetical protein HELRODRAFT_170496 [Helobdella robusta]
MSKHPLTIYNILSSVFFITLTFTYAISKDTVTPKGENPNPDDKPSQKDEDGGKSVWASHWALFMGVLIFIAVSMVLAMVLCICLKVCRKKKGGFPQPETIVTEEPARLTSYGQVQQQAMSENSNGLGGPLPVDEESGWIIPLDQMTSEELDQTEAALSKV